jgi:hypothetical protein
MQLALVWLSDGRVSKPNRNVNMGRRALLQYSDTLNMLIDPLKIF